MCSTCFPRSVLPADASLPSAGSSGAMRAVEVLVGHMWVIGRNDSPDPFYTSIDPFVLRGHAPTILGGIGLESQGISLVRHSPCQPI